MALGTVKHLRTEILPRGTTLHFEYVHYSRIIVVNAYLATAFIKMLSFCLPVKQVLRIYFEEIETMLRISCSLV